MITSRRTIAIRQFVATALVLLAALFVIGHCTGCFEQAKQVVAADSYEAQQMRCVEQYAHRADIDRCRMKVKLAWTTDAAADALAVQWPDAEPFAGPALIVKDGGK